MMHETHYNLGDGRPRIVPTLMKELQWQVLTDTRLLPCHAREPSAQMASSLVPESLQETDHQRP
jgi:hypothetical protein